MTPACAPEVVVEYHFRCTCGAFIVATGRTVTCAYCGQILGIRKVKRHRQHWNTVPRSGTGTRGWRWRKAVVESVVERTFHLQCTCGSTIATTEKTATCAHCGRAVGICRVMQRGQSEVTVEYDFDCCFCGASVGTNGKTATCPNCDKTLRIVRVGTHGQYWKAVPRSADQEVSKPGCLENCAGPLFLMGSLLFCICCLGQYVYNTVIR